MAELVSDGVVEILQMADDVAEYCTDLRTEQQEHRDDYHCHQDENQSVLNQSLPLLTR
jgi:hypothetical protein